MINIPALVSIEFGQRRNFDTRQRDTIPLTPGFRRTTIEHARSVQLEADGGRADVRHLWPATNRKTGIVDCVIGPCTFDEMIETWAALEGGERPCAEMKRSYP